MNSKIMPSQNFMQSMKAKAFLAATLGILFDALDASIYFMVLHPCLSDLLKTTSDKEIGFYGSLILCVFMIGWALGSMIFGVVADRIGRTKTMMLTILLYASFTGLCALSQDWIQLAVCRFFVGIGIGAEISVGSVMLCEFFTGKKRLLACCLMECGFCLGYLATSLANLGLGELSWRFMFLIGIVPAFLALYIRLKLKEPDNFNKVKSIRDGLKNNKENNHLSKSQVDALNKPVKSLFSDLYLKPTLIVVTLTGVAIVGYWAALSWIPAWINQLTGELAVTQRSTAGIVLNVSGFLACILTYPMLQTIGRRNTLSISYFISLVATTGMFMLCKDYGIELLSMIFVVGFFTSIPFVVLTIVIPELFATELLGTAAGLAFGVGRIFAAMAAILSGQLIALFGGSYAVAGASIGLVYGIGFLVALFLPDTTGEVLGTKLGENRKEQLEPSMNH